MRETLPFLGGVQPSTIFKMQKSNYVDEQNIFYADFRIFVQFLNMDVYLQKKLMAEIGLSKEMIYDKLSGFLNKLE